MAPKAPVRKAAPAAAAAATAAAAKPPPEPAQHFRATYTQDAHKKLAKNWKWLDGFLSVRGRDARLLSESGDTVATARLLAGVAVAEGEEIGRGAFGSERIVIQVDVHCSAEDIRGGGGGGGGGDAGDTASPAADAAPINPHVQGRPAGAKPLLQARREGTAGLRSNNSGGGGSRPVFKAPRPAPTAPPLSDTSPPQHAAPLGALPPGRRQFLPPPPAAQPRVQPPPPPHQQQWQQQQQHCEAGGLQLSRQQPRRQEQQGPGAAAAPGVVRSGAVLGLGAQQAPAA